MVAFELPARSDTVSDGENVFDGDVEVWKDGKKAAEYFLVLLKAVDIFDR